MVSSHRVIILGIFCCVQWDNLISAAKLMSADAAAVVKPSKAIS